MRCRQARHAMDLRLDESISLELDFQLDRHLERCEACGEQWLRAQEIEEGLTRLAEPPLARLDVQGCLDRLRDAREGKAFEDDRDWKPVALRRGLPLAAAAAGLLLLVLFNQQAEDTPASDLEFAREFPTSPYPTREPGDEGLDLLPDSMGPGTAPSLVPPTFGEDGSEGELAQAVPPAPPEDPVDDERLARARIEVRGRLLAAYGESRQRAQADQVPFQAAAFAEDLDRRTLALRKESWPTLRIVEGFLKDSDVQVARAAARYIGLRGDRTSLRRLRDCLDSEPLGRSATLALADAGAEGRTGLARALEIPALRTLASDLLIQQESPEAATLVADLLAQELAAPSGPDTPASNDLLDVLIAMGPHSLPALMGLGSVLDRGTLLSVLEEIPRTGSYLAMAIQEAGHPPRRRSGDLETVLRCASTFAPHTAGNWMVEALADRDWEEFCLEELPRLEGVPGVEALVQLDGEAAVSTAVLDELFERALVHDSGRFVDALQKWRQVHVPEDHNTLARRMLSLGSEETLPVVRELLLSKRVALSLRTDLVAQLGRQGTARDLSIAQAVFESCGVEQRQLAAHALLAIHQLGGQESSAKALEGAEPRDQQNILLLLRRLEAETRTTSSLYKLARELRPLLRSRALNTRSSSS